MSFVRALSVLTLLFSLICVSGCGSSVSDELTPDEIAKQRAEDKLDLEAEDKAEAEYQRKMRQQGS